MDPSPAMLEVARKGPGAGRVRWIHTPYGPVEAWLEVVAVEGDRVRFQGHNVFIDSGEHVVAPSTLRFRSAAEISRSLERAGFVVEHMYGDWRRGPLKPESLSIVTIARRSGPFPEGQRR